MGDVCTDGRFDLIERFKRDLVEATNIETSPEEMAVLDSILFRMWQMGWLDRLEQPTASPWHRVEEELPKESNTYIVYLRQGTKVETPEWMGGEPLSYVVEMAFDREQMLWRADDDAYNAILSFVDTERDFHVTHWMEKPKPPKEEKHGN